MRLPLRWAPFVAFAFAGCASIFGKGPAGAPSGLKQAREAVEKARRAGASERVPETFRQAEAHLKEAETLVAHAPAGELEPERAQFLGRLAVAEAQCAAKLARLYPKGPAGDKTPRADDADASVRLRRSEDERRRLEDRVALLQRDLELTEMEVIRTKARLQGIETKAEASSAIAEARILISRLGARDRATASRCQELLEKAEQQIQESNFGAAVFFARKAQDIATKAAGSTSQP
jgi:hypothetical protein